MKKENVDQLVKRLGRYERFSNRFYQFYNCLLCINAPLVVLFLVYWINKMGEDGWAYYSWGVIAAVTEETIYFLPNVVDVIMDKFREKTLIDIEHCRQQIYNKY